jgi:hypothetical protein
MIAQLKQFLAWLQRIVVWMLRMKRFWIAILVPALLIVWLICIRSLRSPEPQIRIAGLITELLGVGTVAIGLREIRKLFDRPSLPERFFRWLKERPPYRIKPNVIQVSGNMAIELRSTGHATSSPPPSWSLEERVNWLEKSLNQTHELIYKTQQQINEEAQKQSNTLESERREREAAVDKTKKLLEEATIGGLYLEATGVLWLMIGIILSHASHEIESILLQFR